MSALSIIKQAIAKQPTGVEAAFKETIKPVVMKEIEVKRAEVGANLFNSEQPAKSE